MKSNTKIWIILIFIFLANQILEHFSISQVLLQSYLDDILCMPIVLFIILLFYNKYLFVDINYSIPISYILISIFFFIFLFELVLPIISKNYIADIFDVIAYTIGALFFYLFMNYWEINSINNT